MAKKYTKEQRNSYTSIVFILFLISFVILCVYIIYCLGISFPEFRIFNIEYGVKTDAFKYLLITSLSLNLGINYMLWSSPVDLNVIFKGPKAGNIIEIVVECLFGLLVIFIIALLYMSYMFEHGANTSDSLGGSIICIATFILVLHSFLPEISDPPGFPTAVNVKYKIKHHNYNDFKRYLADKLGISVNSLELFEEEHCDIEYYGYSKGNDEYCYVLVYLDKMNRKILNDCYDEGFFDFFNYKYKDVDTKKKSFYVYYIFVVEEVNAAFKEMVKYRAPMQKDFYFLGVGVDIKNNELYINGYDKKKFKYNYDLLFNKFDSLIEDIKIK